MPWGEKLVQAVNFKSDISLEEVKKFIKQKWKKALMAGIYDTNGNIMREDIVLKGKYYIAILLEDK